MSVVIEKASRADAAAMLAYLKQIGGETDNLTFGAEGLPFSIEDEAAYIGELESSRDGALFVAKENGRIVGDASLSRLPRRMSHRGDLGIAVVREYWNRGVGSALMRAVIDFARANDFDGIDLQVRSDNRAAIALYEKFGFRTLGTHPAFFKLDGEDIPFDYMYLDVR